VGVFCSPLSHEYALAAQHFGLTREDLVTLCEGVVEIIFADDEEKVRLRGVYGEVRATIEDGKIG
jgi:adenosine deaminase